ncbi:MAG: hypothetical protein IJD77_00935 [Clostridia bacterium]|nr:hypothetical protein [Clostridia bacterium]
MFVNAKTFMELVQKLTALELMVKGLQDRITTLEKRPIYEGNQSDDETEANRVMDLYTKMFSGEKDPKLGRVRYTDGTD